MSEEIYKKTISELYSLLKSRQLKAVEIAGAFLKRIENIDEKLNAFLSIRSEETLKESEDVDRKIAVGVDIGPLDGIPIAVKNNIITKDIETNCGSKILCGFKPPFDATAIKRLKDAGTITLGKTNMDEFAMGSSNEHSAYGPVGNPWDVSRIPGGSSGGSAAAVASGMAPAALGSETAGSVRQPAALCGISGLKPTYGRISRYGLVAFGSSLDQIGPMARTAEDLAYLMKAMSGVDPYDSTSSSEPVADYPSILREPVKGIKVGIPKEYFSEGLDPEIENAVRNAAKVLSENGCLIEDISLPHTDYGIACYYILAPAEASSNLARYDGIRYGFRAGGDFTLKELYSETREQGFGEEIKRRIMLGTFVLSSGYYDAYYRKAQKVRTLILRDFAEAFKRVDYIVTPTTPTTAFKKGEKTGNPLSMYLSDVYTANVNLAGIPAISVPAGLDSKGLPVGVQIMGKWFDEGGILKLAHFYQQLTDHHLAFPPNL
jgi:aspartyl-tRNA(Asn)/glutamyl-tRNA(Gln) amidotransferase subunit A